MPLFVLWILGTAGVVATAYNAGKKTSPLAPTKNPLSPL